MSGLISIAVTGINAAQAGLLTTANNISNLNTEGYNRQRIIQVSNPTVMTGAGGFGQGTHVVTVSRMYSEALSKQVLSAQAQVSALDTYYSQISQIDNLMADADSGLSPAIQEFFDSIQAVAGNPSSTSARQSMVSGAESMVSSFRSIYGRLDEIEAGVNSQIGSTVNSINSYTEQIAYLNQKIVSSASLGGQPVNDLLDKRDQLIADLNKLVKVETSLNDDGSYNVFVGTGQQLVVGSRATEMAAIASSADPTRIVVGLVGESGAVQELPERLITGGQLGGLLSFRSEALDTAFNQLGLLAASVTQTFNAQHALGMDLLGNIAGDSGFAANFFETSDPVVIANARNATGGAVVSAALSPASYSGTNYYTNLTDSDYRLAYDGTDFTLTRLSDNSKWTGATLADVNTALASDPQGFTLTDDGGTFTAGDSFIIQPSRDMARLFDVNSNISADPRLIAAALPVNVSGITANGGTGSVDSVQVSAGYSVGAGSLMLTYDASAGNMVFPDGSTVAFTSGQAFTINNSGWSGIQVTISGTPAWGDQFTLSLNNGGVEDGSNIVRLGNLQTQNTMLGANATFEDSYAAFVNDIGNRTASAQISSEAQTTLLSQATAARESVSGVNSDEEAAKLIEYQQAYQASAKILEVATTLFDTLISIG